MARNYYGWEEEIIEPEEELERTPDQDKGPELESITDIENEVQDMGDQEEEDLGMEDEEGEDVMDEGIDGMESFRRKNKFYSLEDYEEDIGIDTGDDDESVEDVVIEETPPTEEVTEEVVPEATNLDVTAEVSVEPTEVTEEEVEEDALNEETQELDTVTAVENWANKIGIYGLENDDPVTIHVETGEIDKDITLEGSNVSINDCKEDTGSSDEMPEEIDDGTNNNDNNDNNNDDNNDDNNKSGNESWSSLEQYLNL